VCQRKATTTASASGVRRVERIAFEPMRASPVVRRPRRFCTVVGMTP
jgi:hypothetical protein